MVGPRRAVGRDRCSHRAQSAQPGIDCHKIRVQLVFCRKRFHPGEAPRRQQRSVSAHWMGPPGCLFVERSRRRLFRNDGEGVEQVSPVRRSRGRWRGAIQSWLSLREGTGRVHLRVMKANDLNSPAGPVGGLIPSTGASRFIGAAHARSRRRCSSTGGGLHLRRRSVGFRLADRCATPTTLGAQRARHERGPRSSVGTSPQARASCRPQTLTPAAPAPPSRCAASARSCASPPCAPPPA
jgi:hypothetical protein